MFDGFTQKLMRAMREPHTLTAVIGPGRLEMHRVCLRCVRLIFHCSAAGPSNITSTCCSLRISQGAGDYLRKSM